RRSGGRSLAAAPAGGPDLLQPSGGVLEEKRGAQLSAVEPAVAAGGDERRAQPAAADRAVQGRLADAEQLRGLTRGEELGALRLVLEGLGERLDVGFAETAVATRRHERRMEQTAHHGARDGRLADAEAGCHILRTDQSVQDVVLGLTNPYQKAVGVVTFFPREPWNSTSGAGISSLKMCRDKPTDSQVS